MPPRTRRIAPSPAVQIVTAAPENQPKAVRSFDFDATQQAIYIALVDGTQFKFPMTREAWAFFRKHYVRR